MHTQFTSQIDGSKPEQGLATTESVRANFRHVRDEIGMIVTGTGFSQLGTTVYQTSATDVTPYRRLLRMVPGTNDPLYIRFRMVHSYIMPLTGTGHVVERLAQDTIIAQNRSGTGESWAVLATNTIGFNLVRAYISGSYVYYLDVDARGQSDTPTRLQVIETNCNWYLENQQAVNPNSYPGGEQVLVQSLRDTSYAGHKDNIQVSGLKNLANAPYATLDDVGLRMGQSFQLNSPQARKELCVYIRQFTNHEWSPTEPRFQKIAYIRMKNTGNSDISFRGGSAFEVQFGTGQVNVSAHPRENPYLLRGMSFVDFYPRGQNPSGVYDIKDYGGWIASDNSATLMIPNIYENGNAEDYICTICVLPGNHVWFGTGQSSGSDWSDPFSTNRLIVPFWHRNSGYDPWIITQDGGQFNSHNGALSGYLIAEVWLKP